MAEKLNVSPGTIGNWETAKSSPNLGELERVSQALNASIGYLLGLTDAHFHKVESSAWANLSEATLRAAISDLGGSSGSNHLQQLEEVVAELRRRNTASSGSVVEKALLGREMAARVAGVRLPTKQEAGGPSAHKPEQPFAAPKGPKRSERFDLGIELGVAVAAAGWFAAVHWLFF